MAAFDRFCLQQPPDYRGNETLGCVTRTVGKENARPRRGPSGDSSGSFQRQRHRSLCLSIDRRRTQPRAQLVAILGIPFILGTASYANHAFAAVCIKLPYQFHAASEPIQILLARSENTWSRDPSRVKQVRGTNDPHQGTERRAVEQIQTVPVDTLVAIPLPAQ